MKFVLNCAVIIFILFLSNCKKDDQPVLVDYDCYMKYTYYNSSGEITSWYKSYFLVEKVVKKEDSGGNISEYEYDNFGNTISMITNSSKIEYEYNTDNELIKTIYYTNNQLDYYSVSIDIGPGVRASYSIDNNNDTTRWSYGYYNSENQIDSVISDAINTYFFYSDDIDSVITIYEGQYVTSRRFFKYDNEHKIYDEGRMYNVFGEEHRYFIINWEYNENGLLIRQTQDHLYSSGNTQWIDERKYYDDNDKIIRVESYDEDNNLMGYSKQYYEDMILNRIESFNNTDNLSSYIIIENTCGN